MPFKCVIVTPEQQVLDESITEAVIPAHDGLMGIEVNRAPLLVKLGIGPLRVDIAGKTSKFFLVEGGIAQMKDNLLTILTQKAIPASEIDAQSAKAELAEAQARRITDEKSFNDRQAAIKRSMTKQELAGKN
ncbi:F0F1 ATP synthase subunit epsilon [soil metagenome]